MVGTRDKISAGELRAMGAEIPAHIPNHATIPASCVNIEVEDVEMCDDDNTSFNVLTQISFTEQFTFYLMPHKGIHDVQ